MAVEILVYGVQIKHMDVRPAGLEDAGRSQPNPGAAPCSRPCMSALVNPLEVINVNTCR